MSRRFVEKTVASPAVAEIVREQYRQLATILHQTQAATGIRTVVIASALPEEGKTLTAANLAMTLAGPFEQRVLLVDADLRRPLLHQMFDIPFLPAPRSDRGAAPVPVVVTDRLSVQIARVRTSNPIDALASDRMRSFLADARTRYDWVLVDTPPVGLLPDTRLLAPHADGVLLVVAANRTPWDLVQRAVDAIGRPRLLGVVLNQAEERAVLGGYDYQRYYGSYKGYGAGPGSGLPAEAQVS